MIDTKLNTLLKVVEVGSYTEAGKQLNLTQPAVSQHIKALEEQLHVKLFEHSGNRIVSKNECKKVVTTARSMRSLYKKLVNELSGKMRGKRHFMIGITHTIESNAITEAFARYVTNNDDIMIRLVSDTKNQLLNQIKHFELDFAVVDGRVEDPIFQNLMMDEDAIMLIVYPKHPLAKMKSVEIEQLKKENLLLRFPNSGTSNLFQSLLTSMHMSIQDFNVKLEIDNIATIKNLVKSEYGISILPKSACKHEINQKELIALPINNFQMKRETNIVYLQDFQYTDFLYEIINIYHELYD